jgi:hypothetical protein
VTKMEERPMTSRDREPRPVFISYAHGSAAHVEEVRAFWLFLRANGVNAQLDLTAADRRQVWPEWIEDQLHRSAFILVIASPAFRERAEARPDPATAVTAGRGARYEAAMLRELVYSDPAARQRVLPVLLPGYSVSDIPRFLHPTSGTHYTVKELTVDGAERLLRVLTGQPAELVPELGPVPVLPPRGVSPVPTPRRSGRPADRRVDRSSVATEASAVPDFFVSYASVDRPWAEWIATELENAGYPTTIGAWDFPAGTDSGDDVRGATPARSRTIVSSLLPTYAPRWGTPIGKPRSPRTRAGRRDFWYWSGSSAASRRACSEPVRTSISWISTGPALGSDFSPPSVSDQARTLTFRHSPRNHSAAEHTTTPDRTTITAFPRRPGLAESFARLSPSHAFSVCYSPGSLSCG